jgi:hypothetical protein
MADNTGNLIGIIFCFIILLIAIVAVIWGLNNKQPVTKCSQNNECLSTQTCDNGTCTYKTCRASSECGTDQTCTSGFCYQNTCEDNTGCTGINICNNGLCTPFGTSCESDSNCFNSGLICVNKRCVQCAGNVDCGAGSVCGGDGKCYTNCNTAISQGGTGICPAESPNCNSNGVCCPSNSRPCSSGCGTDYCVNGICSCSQGNINDRCTQDRDCQSGKCLQGANTCQPSGAVCNGNYSGVSINGIVSCPSATNPFCVNGQCGNQAAIASGDGSIGAPCSCNTYNPGGINQGNSQYNCCNLSGTGYAGSFTYCVNNFCSLNPGPAGSHCTANTDCQPLGNPPIQRCSSNNICTGV